MTTTAATSDYLENKIVNHVLRNTGFSPPAHVYIALYTTNPTDADTGIEINISASAASYQRVEMTAGFNAPTNRATANTNAIIYPTATGSWGNVSHIGIMTGSASGATSGSLLFYGTLSASVAVIVGDIFSIPAGDLDISFGGAYSNYLANNLLGSILNGTAFSSPGTNVYATLYTTVPSWADSGGVEVAAGEYDRVQIAGTGDWSVPTNGSTVNVNAEVFVASATENWGTIRGMGLRTGSTGGQLLFVGNFTTPKTIYIGDGFQFDAGKLVVDVDVPAPPV